MRVCVSWRKKITHMHTHTLTLTHMSATAASNVSIIASWMLMHHANAETPQTNCTAASWAHRCRPALPNLLCVRVCVCVYLGMHVCRCLCRCVFVDDITLHICLQGHVWSRMCFSQDFCRAAHLHLPSPGSWSEGCISEVLPMLHNWHAESRPRWAAWKLWCGTSPAAQCDKEKLKKWNFNSAWNTLNKAWWWMM